jgi:hypothetical protein
MSDPTQSDLANDLLQNGAAIAEYLFGDRKYRRRVYYLAERGKLPIFRLRAQLYARKSTLRKFIEDAENQSKNG